MGRIESPQPMNREIIGTQAGVYEMSSQEAEIAEGLVRSILPKTTIGEAATDCVLKSVKKALPTMDAQLPNLTSFLRDHVAEPAVLMRGFNMDQYEDEVRRNIPQEILGPDTTPVFPFDVWHFLITASMGKTIFGVRHAANGVKVRTVTEIPNLADNITVFRNGALPPHTDGATLRDMWIDSLTLMSALPSPQSTSGEAAGRTFIVTPDYQELGSDVVSQLSLPQYTMDRNGYGVTVKPLPILDRDPATPNMIIIRTPTDVLEVAPTIKGEQRENAEAALELWRNHISPQGTAHRFVVDWRIGDVLVLNNSGSLHGREGYPMQSLNNGEGSQRLMRRTYGASSRHIKSMVPLEGRQDVFRSPDYDSYCRLLAERRNS